MSIFPVVILCCLLHFALSEVITQSNVQAFTGSSANLSCSLPSSNDEIVQVTWQKKISGTWENMASYSKKFGIKIQPFASNVAFSNSVKLWNATIIISNLSFENSSCYKCLFSGHPDGTLSATTCLSVVDAPIVNQLPVSSYRISPTVAPTSTTTHASLNPAATFFILFCIFLFIILIVMLAYLAYLHYFVDLPDLSDVPKERKMTTKI